MAIVTAPILDRHAAMVLARTGMVCLATGMARCWRCSARMREAVINSEVGYWCPDSHFLTQAVVDAALWAYYLTQAGQPILNTIVDPAQRRGPVHRTFSTIVLDPEYETIPAACLVKAVYPRLAF